MAKKDYFLLLDTETTQPRAERKNKKGEITREGRPSYVADFGAVVVDRKGREYARCAVMVADVYKAFPLFFSSDASDSVFGRHTLDRRVAVYDAMLESGQRMLASVNAINRWLENVKGKYDPILTAYNLAFDRDKCGNTQIDLSMFDKRFCLWYASADKWAGKKDYKNFVLDLHSFTNTTKLGNSSYRTNAETMARYIMGDPLFPDEPHTALEDAVYYELPILVKLVNSTKKEKWMNPKGYNWRDFQLKDHFIAK